MSFYTRLSATLIQSPGHTLPPISGWTGDRKAVVINNTGNASALTDYQIKVSVTYTALMKADFSDLRFIDNDEITLLNYWLESKVDSTSAVFWVKVPSIPALSSKTIYIYFNNPLAKSTSNGELTFLFFDTFGDGTAWERAGAPAGSGVVEGSMIMDGPHIDLWYRGGWSPAAVGYARAEDPLAVSWTRHASNPIIAADKLHPYTLKHNETYYMFLKHISTGHIYLYSSTDKITWTIMNGGTEVYGHSSTTTNWDYTIYNCAVVVIGDVWHMMIEGKSNTSGFRLGYAYSNLTELNWSAHRTTTHLIDLSGNPFLIHVPDRNALLMLYGSMESNIWRIRARRASLANNLALAASWVLASSFSIDQASIHIADIDMVVTNNLRPHNLIFQYGYNQANIYQAYSDLSLTDFYDAVGGGSNVTLINNPANPVLETPYLASKWTVRGSMALDAVGALDMPSNTASDQTPTVENTFSGVSYVLEMKATTTSTGDRLQPIFAYIDDNNFGRFWFADPSTTYFQQKIASVFGTAVAIGANNAVNGSYHKLKMVKTGTQVTLFIDDVQVGSAQTLNAVFNANTKIGISGYNTVGKWDDVRVRKYTTPEPSVTVS